MANEKTSDVPAQVYAELCAAMASTPDGQPSAAGQPDWWERYAVADEAQAEALLRLKRWAIDTGQPMAVVWAIDDAVTFRRQQAREDRREAERPRRHVADQREEHEALVASAAG